MRSQLQEHDRNYADGKGNVMIDLQLFLEHDPSAKKGGEDGSRAKLAINADDAL